MHTQTRIEHGRRIKRQTNANPTNVPLILHMNLKQKGNALAFDSLAGAQQHTAIVRIHFTTH